MLTLTEDQKDKVKVAWYNKKIRSIKKIIEFVWEESTEDTAILKTRGILVKNYLIDELQVEVSTRTEVKEAFELNETQKEYVVSNANRSKPIQMAAILFPDVQGKIGFSKEYKAVKDYYDSLDPAIKAPEEGLDGSKYGAPKSDTQTISRVNRYTDQNLVMDKLSQKHKDCLAKTSQYCRLPRFMYEMNKLRSKEERELMESDYIKYIWDKPDLMQEDLDMYCTVASWLIDIQRMKSELEMMQRYAEDQMDESDGKMNLALTQAIKELRTEIRQKESERNKTLEKLNGARKERMNKGKTGTMSLGSFVEIFREKEKRDKYILLAEKRKEKLKEELRDISTMDAAKFEIWGLSPEEVL